jgi:hypothetical protein
MTISSWAALQGINLLKLGAIGLGAEGLDDGSNIIELCSQLANKQETRTYTWQDDTLFNLRQCLLEGDQQGSGWSWSCDY